MSEMCHSGLMDTSLATYDGVTQAGTIQLMYSTFPTKQRNFLEMIKQLQISNTT